MELRFRQKKIGPGKFEGETAAAMVVNHLSFDGTDENAGDQGGGGAAFGKMTGPFLMDALQDEECVEILEEYGTEEDLEVLATAVGAIVSEDNQGFVHVEFFAPDAAASDRSGREFEAAWGEVLENEGEVGDDEEEEEDV